MKIPRIEITVVVLMLAVSLLPAFAPAATSKASAIEDALSKGTRLDKAQAIFEILLRRTPNDPDIYKYLGDVHAAKNQPRKAVEYYTQYSEMRPQDYYPHYRMGEIAWAGDERNKAKRSFRKAMHLLPAETEDRQARIAEARMSALLGDEEKSDDLYHELLAEHPDDLDVQTSYVNTLIDTGRYGTAQTVVEHYVAERPGSYELRRSQARVLVQRHEYDEAREILEQLMERYPNDRGLKEDYAFLHYNEGDWCQAVPLFQELSEDYPDSTVYEETLEDLFRRHRPTLYWGLGARFVGSERRFGPYVRFVHPVNTQWSYEAGYTFDRNKASIPGFDPDFTTYTHDIDLLLHYQPHRKIVLSAGMVNQIARSKYSAAALASFELDDPLFGLFTVDFAYNRTFDDPTNALYFDGKKDRIGFDYENRLFDRLIISALYSSIWYRVDASRTGTGLGDDFGREDIGGGGLQVIVLRKPEIRLGYGFVYSKLHVKNDYLPLIPLIQESARHNIIFGFYNEWNKWLITDVTGYLGHDSKRGASLGDLDLYGFAITNRVRINKRFEISGTYEYSSESLINEQGRYQFFSIDFLYRF